MRITLLDRIPSIKVKLSILIVGAVGISAVVSYTGWRLGFQSWFRVALSVVLALIIMRLFAFGMVSPLREMARAAHSMAEGDYSQRVQATSTDEVGVLARAFNDMSTKLGEVDRQRRELVANASHELRTPIAALQAMIENLADGVSEPDTEFVATLQRQVQRLSHLVEQLTSLSRLDSGETELHAQPLIVNDLLQQVVDESEWRYPGSSIGLQLDPSQPQVNADPMLLHQVVSNLVENAFRHGAEPVSIASRLRDATVLISVSDGGPGIALEHRDVVFQRFHRLDESRRSGGSGLGLAIVAGIVDRHGGEVSVTDLPGGGCCVQVALPVLRTPFGVGSAEASVR